jgi:hypothetical protein
MSPQRVHDGARLLRCACNDRPMGAAMRRGDFTVLSFDC